MVEVGREEILRKSYTFVQDHVEDSDERQQAQSWTKDFLDVFGIPRQKINIGFEWRVNIDGSQKYIDHLLNGILLIEMKSRGKSLEKAKSQAYKYVMNLSNEDLPKYLMISDFETIKLYDLIDSEKFWTFKTKDLSKHIDLFDFLINKDVKVYIPQNPVNERAARTMEQLHKTLVEGNYPLNYTNLLMTRVVFCLFADSSTIFKSGQFRNYILNHTKMDGSDLVDKLAALFQSLNTEKSIRWQKGDLADFEYINGGLFKEPQLTGFELDSVARDLLIEATTLNWSKISPVIFGSMFEGAMNNKRRQRLGAHYTSEKNILKIINSLFLDDLRNEFELICSLKRGKAKELERFHDKLAKLKFIDPACGSGNFLMVAYREIRRLEHEVIDESFGRQGVIDISELLKVEVNQFYGIEIVPYAVSISKLGLWLMDHLMNLEASEMFGHHYARLPLHAGANIHCADALLINWEDVIEAKEIDYILGNPPFIGQTVMTSEQKSILANACPNIKKIKKVDFVAGWYVKSAELMLKNPQIKAALVSTSSIVQGEQAIILWQELFKLGISINFAHQTFKWDNNGAAVHVVIIGFSRINTKNKTLFEYTKVNGNPIELKVSQINEYLIPAKVVGLKPMTRQISGQPAMRFGTMPRDGGNYILSYEEANYLWKKYPESHSWIRPYVGAQELIQGMKRYILYLKDANPKDIRKVKEVQTRISAVRDFRLKSKASSTRAWANRPLELVQDQAPETDVLVIPEVSSERREYIPIAFAKHPTIVSNKAFQIAAEDALYIFGILETRMHMSWLKVVGGRLESRYNYSNTLVYNTFVFPKVSEIQKIKIEKLAQDILDIRQIYIDQENTLADLYDPNTMPPDLKRAHQILDREVDYLYRKTPFLNDEERAQLLVDLFVKESTKINSKKTKTISQ